MGHIISNKARDAYFLAESDALMKVYLKYMEHLTLEQREVSSNIHEVTNVHGLEATVQN